MIPIGPMPANPPVPGLASIKPPPVDPGDAMNMNHMQVEALGGPARRPMAQMPPQPMPPQPGGGGPAPISGGIRQPPVVPGQHRRFNSGTADDPAYMAQLQQQQHTRNPGYHGFVPPRSKVPPHVQPTPQVGLLGPPVTPPVTQ